MKFVGLFTIVILYTLLGALGYIESGVYQLFYVLALLFEILFAAGIALLYRRNL